MELQRIFTRGFSPKKQYKEYELKFLIKPDGSAEDTRHFEINALGDTPLSCLEMSYELDAPGKDFSFADLNIVVKDEGPGNTDVSALPSKNMERVKSVGVFFLPSIPPGESRKVSVKATIPGAFQRLVNFEEDEINVETLSDKPINQSKLLIELDKDFGDISVGSLSGKSANLAQAMTPQITSSGGRLYGWEFPEMDNLYFSVRIKRQPLKQS